MRAGNLDRTIVIQRCTVAADDYGTPVETWVPITPMRAQLLQHAIDDRETARGAVSDSSLVFRIRFLAGVTLADRVAYEGQVFTIKQIKEIGRRVGLDLKCEHVGA